LNAALKNIYRFLTNPIRCPWCGEDISLHIVKCPSGKHSLPLGLSICPLCRRRIEYIKCPHCKKPLSPYGFKVVFKRPRHLLVTGRILGATSAILVGAGYILSQVSLLAGYIAILSSGLLAGLAYSALKIKMPSEIREQT
jgi:hypothetical protein